LRRDGTAELRCFCAIPTRDKTFDAAFKGRTGQHHAAIAGGTNNANFGTNTNHPPGITTTGVWFAGLHKIIKVDWDWCVWHRFKSLKHRNIETFKQILFEVCDCLLDC
jgi:hypothetical protein